MSLITDKVFYNALKASTDIMALTDGRIYNTAIPEPDEELENEPLPYIIITFDGMTNDDMTKDNGYEGETDRVQIGVLCVAESREELGPLTQAVRNQIEEYFSNISASDEDYALVPDDYQLSATPVMYDPLMPCYHVQLQYNCDTTP